jgi:hypothetical protein
MLDIALLHQQLDSMGEELRRQATVNEGRLDAAVRLYEIAANDDAALVERFAAFEEISTPPWLVAGPVEPLGTIKRLPPVPGAFTVVATDGSQMAPSHHEIALCYVINVGRILYTYGTGEMPLQDSRPSLHHREGDMRPVIGGRSVALSEEVLGALRDVAERQALVGLAERAVERGHPAVALSDGTLVLWTLEDKPEDVREALLADHLACLDRLRALRVPVAGYLSGSRAMEVANLLRLAACPKERLICEACALESPPCETEHLPLGDRRLWERRLAPGERSPLFASRSAIVSRYGPHRIQFFYLHVGAEIARIEVPAWVAEDAELLDRVHALAFDQAQKGMGYPITLQEAHNQAVVTREDRARFFSLLAGRMQQLGVRVSQSNKQLKKRSGIV